MKTFFSPSKTLKTTIKLNSIFLVFLFITSNLLAQQAIDSLNFATDGDIRVAQISENALYLGGSFNNIGKMTKAVAFFNKGSLMPDDKKPLFGDPYNFTALDEVFAVLPDGSGGWLVGGKFEKVNNRDLKTLVHIDANNDVNENFALPFTSVYGNLNISVLKQNENFIYIGGKFSLIDNGVEHINVLRMDKETYQVDPTWNPDLVLNSSTYIDQIEIGESQVFLAGYIGLLEGLQQLTMAVVDKTNGQRIAFPSTNSSSPKLHLMGDTLFMGKTYIPVITPGFGYINKGISLFNAQDEILTNGSTIGIFYESISDGNGGFYAAGALNGQSGVFHLDENLQILSAFSQDKIKNFDVATASIQLTNNNLYISNSYNYFPTSVQVDGNSIEFLYKLDANTGAIDPNFKPNPNGRVFTTLLKGDTLFVGGAFNEIAGVERTGLAALNANTGEAYDWNPAFADADGFFMGFSDHHISDLLLIDNTLYASGIFLTQSDGEDNISSLVRFDLTTGNIDPTFHLFTEKNNIPDFTSMLYKEGMLYLAGDFEISNASGTIKNVGVLNLNTSDFEALNPNLDFELLPSGPYDSQGLPKITENNGLLYITGYTIANTFSETNQYFLISINLATKQLSERKIAPNSCVYTTTFSGEKMLLSGLFDMVKWYPYNLAGININTKEYIELPPMMNIEHGLDFASNEKYLFIGSGFEKYGESTVNGLVRLNRSDLSVSPFDHQIAENTGEYYIRNLALSDDGLYVSGFFNEWSSDPSISSGAFNSVAGVSRQNICLLDAETAALKPWNPPPYNTGSVRVFAFDKDIVLSSDFSLMPSANRVGLAKIDLSNGEVADWNPVIGGYFANVYTLLVSNDTLYVGGDEIETINDINVKNISAISTISGSLLTGLSFPDIDGSVTALYKNGNLLYAAGNFQNVNSQSQNKIARFNSNNGSLDTWNPNLESSWNMELKDILTTNSSVFVVGKNLQISGNTLKGQMIKLDESSAILQKNYPSGSYDKISSIAQNNNGDIVAGLISNGSGYSDFLFFDQQNDTLIPIEKTPVFSYGIKKIKSIGNLFLVTGNHMKEFGWSTNKPGMFIYDPINDSITSSFSTPLIDGDINTFAADDQTLVFAGNFWGMNGFQKNANIAFMKTPELNLQANVSSWSPKTTSNTEPFGLRIYGNGFLENSKVSLILGTDTRLPDSVQITNRKIIAYFDGKDFSNGLWKLKVEIDTENTLEFTNAIRFEEGEKSNVWANWTGPSEVMVNRPTTFYLNYGNSGDQAAYGVFLYLAVGRNQTLTFPEIITRPQLPFEVEWDTISSDIDIDYFMGEPYEGKAYILFLPYVPPNFDYAMKLELTSLGAESYSNEILIAINEPLYDSYDELIQSNKSTEGIFYSFFRCAYDVAGTIADLTPGVSCIKSIFDNTVITSMDKYMSDQEVEALDVTKSFGLIALGCVPGGATVGKAYKISKEMVEMGTSIEGSANSCWDFVDKFTTKKKHIKNRLSHDPNAKYGPSGQAASVYVQSEEAYHYMITYENDSLATAPATRVIINDTLDKNVFDISSFQPLGFGFADTVYLYKETDTETVDIDLRPEKDIIVRVVYALDAESAVLNWKFLTLDPNTFQLTENIDAGFLPPNKTAPEGEGHVIYSIQPLNGLADKTLINNTAHIVFDWNESIITNTWSNYTDNTSPESKVLELPAKVWTTDFNVNWEGNDETSAVYSYTIYVSENDGDYYSWLNDTHENAAIFSGELGKTYKFYSVAVDSAGNQEDIPAQYDAITEISALGTDNFGDIEKISFRLYPNPVLDVVHVEYYLPQNSEIRIDVINACGFFATESYQAFENAGKVSRPIDLSHLPAGYYFIRIKSKYGIQTRKLIKEGSF